MTKGWDTAIVFHKEDLDGNASAAIVKRKAESEGGEAKLFPTDYLQFQEKLHQAADCVSRGQASRIDILDIGMSPSRVPEVVDTISDISAPVTYLDHHELGEWALPLGRCLTSVNGAPNNCTAEVSWLFYMPHDPTSNLLGKLAHVTDFNLNQYGSLSFGQVTLAHKLDTLIKADQSETVICQMVDNLSKGKLWDEKMEDVYIERKKLESEEYVQLPLRVQVRESSGLRVAYSYSPVLHPFEISKFLSGLDEADLVVGINPNSTNVGISRTKSCEVNVSKICNSLGGGGHPDRAGFTYLEPVLSENSPSEPFTSKLESAIRDYLLLETS